MRSYAAVALNVNAISGYPIIDVPTLMIWGEQDIALGKETTYGTEYWVRDLTLRYLPHASHWVQQDVPDDVNAILEAWLTAGAQHAAPSASTSESA